MDLAKEALALESLTKLLRAADECRTLFDEAGMDYPAPLRRMLGLKDDTMGDWIGQRRSVRIPPPAITRPAGLPDGSVAVPIPEMTPQTVVLGVLRAALPDPVPRKQVASEVKARGLEVNDGSIANIGTRLEGYGLISRHDGGWMLTDRSKAPVLNGHYAWGPPEIFTPHELAARRREAIIHVLGHFGAGLQTTQILERLADCAWLKTPLSKDLLKTDMEDLQNQGKIRRGQMRKWTVVKNDHRPQNYCAPTVSDHRRGAVGGKSIACVSPPPGVLVS